MCDELTEEKKFEKLEIKEEISTDSTVEPSSYKHNVRPI